MNSIGLRIMSTKIKVKWGDDEETIKDQHPSLTPLQLRNLFHVLPRKCDVCGREREEGEVEDDEYSDVQTKTVFTPLVVLSCAITIPKPTAPYFRF